MLPRIWRLTKDVDFNQVFRKGRKVSTRYFTFRWHTSPTLEFHTRFGFIVSHTVARKANKRNVLKRRMREAVHSSLSLLRSQYGISGVFIAHPGAGELSFHDIQNELKTLLKKSAILSMARPHH